MKAKHLIALFELMVGWAYAWGESRWKCVDCSGAFVWAFRMLEQSIYHGSNTIWREYLEKKGPLDPQGKTPPRPGSAVFKEKDGDFYHIGLYIGEGKVIEAKSAKYGVVVSPLEGWTHFGELKAVDYDSQDQEDEKENPFGFSFLEPLTVNTQSGRLNLRAFCGGSIIHRLEKGEAVRPLLFRENWVRVLTHDGRVGWVDGAYLARQEPAGPSGETQSLPESILSILREADRLLASIPGVRT